MALKPDWPQTQLQLDRLFRDGAEKEVQRQRLVDWLTEHPLDPDGHFMLGVLGHFEGEQELAEAAFKRTIDLTGIGDHAAAFLPKPVEEEAANVPAE